MIDIKQKFKKTSPWFKWGILGYILGLLYALNSLIGQTDWPNIEQIIESGFSSLAAGSIYFFIFATVSYWIKKKNLKDNAWAILTLGFYIASVFLAFPQVDGNIIKSISFTFLYGFFFVQFVSGFIDPFFYIKNIDLFQFLITIIYNIIFFSWMFLEFSTKKFKNIDKIRIIKLILLLLLFLMLSMGMISCASDLSY